MTGNTFYGGLTSTIFEMEGATLTHNTFSAFYYILGVAYSNDNTFTNITFSRAFYSGVTISKPRGHSLYSPHFFIAAKHGGSDSGHNNTFAGNTFSQTGTALNVVTGMNGMLVTGNNFKNIRSRLIANGANRGNVYDGNWFDTFDEPAESCDDDGNGVCVQDFIISSVTVDANPLTSEIGGVTPPSTALSSCSEILQAGAYISA